MLKESLRMSWQNIRGNKMRTFLTMLGIIIGVLAIITLITLMQSATDEMTSRFESLGAGRVTLSVYGSPMKSGLTENDILQLNSIDNLTGVDPSIGFTRHVYSEGVLVEDVSIDGHSQLYFSAGSVEIGSGRPLLPLDMDRHARVCVIDNKLKGTLFPNESALNKTITVSGQSFLVVGVLSDSDDADLMSAFSGGGDHGTVLIPYQAAMAISGTGSIRSLTLYIQDTDRTNETLDAVRDVLNAAFNYKDRTYRLINLDSLLDTMNSMVSMMTTLLAGIASIALLVGGIGIMNMMLVSVTERTTEIGLRKALGARPVLIQIQFLMESIMLSLFGGAIGIVAGNLLAWLIAEVVDIEFKISISAILLAFFFSAGVGILFGWAPARKASQLNPIDALRSV